MADTVVVLVAMVTVVCGVLGLCMGATVLARAVMGVAKVVPTTFWGLEARGRLRPVATIACCTTPLTVDPTVLPRGLCWAIIIFGVLLTVVPVKESPDYYTSGCNGGCFLWKVLKGVHKSLHHIFL